MGSLGPTPGCLRQRGSKTTAHAGLPLVAGSGPLGPRPWLFGACARRAESMLTDSGVLGSPPWLFVIFQASRAAAHHTTCTGKGKHLQDHTRPLPAAQEVCVAHHHRRVSVANGQPAPRRCYAPVIGTLGHWSFAGGSATTGQPSPCRQCKHHARGNSARWRGPIKQAPHACRHLQLGSGGGRSHRPRARIRHKSALEAGLQLLIAGGFRPTYHGPEIWDGSGAEPKLRRPGPRCCRCA